MKKLFTAKNVRRIMSIAMVCLMLFAISPCVFAAGTDPLDGSAAQDIMTKLIQIIEKLFIYIGIGLAVWGVGQFILSVKNDDADSKARALKVIIAAICAISIGGITDAIGIENYL